MRQRTYIAARDDAGHARAVVRSIYANTPAMDPLLRDPEVTIGLELRNYLRTIFRGRTSQTLALGSLEGWARAVAYASARIDIDVTPTSVARHAQWVGIAVPGDFIDRVAVEVAAAKAAGALKFDAHMIGEMVQLTAAEREEYGIRRLIEACDETRHERINRLRREKRGALPRSQSITSTEPWISAGVSRRTWYRRMAQIRSTTNDSSMEEWCSTKSVPTAGCSTKSVPRKGGGDE